MKKYDIILINCPITFAYHLNVMGDQSYWPPLGILYLGAVLEKQGVRVKILDPAIRQLSLAQIMDIISQSQTKIVGLSALTSGIRTCLQMAEGIRERFGDTVKICLGGSHISADPDFFDRFPLFDVAITGEAESTFPGIAQQLLNGGDIQGIFQGVPVKDLDSLPLPARHLVRLEEYACHKTKEIGLLTSRGCPFTCSFCSRPAVSNRYRRRSAKNIVDEITLYVGDGWHSFYFLDDILTLNRNHIVSLCEEIISRGLKIKWGSNTRADCVDEELIELMAQAGCSVMQYGIESGNPRIRNQIIGKNVENEEIIKAIRMTNEKNIISGMFLMMGFPTEGDAEIRDTMRFSILADPSIIGVHLTKPMPGASIFKQGIAEGCIPPDVIDLYATGKLGEGFAENWPVYVPKGMTLKKLNNAKKKAIFLFYLRPKWIARNAKRYLLNWRILWFDFKKAVSILIKGQSKESMS